VDDLLFLTVVKEALAAAVRLAGAPLAAALLVGLAVALAQAVTQIQEMTLTFVPKAAVLFVVLVLFGPLLMSGLFGLTNRVHDLILDYRHVAGRS
jgi:flagellar biosynthetic protein FliQ